MPRTFLLISLMLLLRFSFAHAGEEEQWVEFTAELVRFEANWYHRMEMTFTDSIEGDTTINMSVVSPMAEFRIENSSFGVDHKVMVLFSDIDSQKNRILRQLRKPRSIGRQFVIRFPTDFFDSKHGRIEFSSLGEITPFRRHNSSLGASDWRRTPPRMQTGVTTE